jgi:hypothetical protein
MDIPPVTLGRCLPHDINLQWQDWFTDMFQQHQFVLECWLH